MNLPVGELSNLWHSEQNGSSTNALTINDMAQASLKECESEHDFILYTRDNIFSAKTTVYEEPVVLWCAHTKLDYT